MKYISVILILICMSLTIVTGCSLVKSSSTQIAEATDIFVPVVSFDQPYLDVRLTPLGAAKADVTYTVDLYEEGIYRASTTAKWNKPQLEVKSTIDVYFPITYQEKNAWLTAGNLLSVFSVNVHQ